MPGPWDGKWTAPPPAYEQHWEEAPSPEREQEWTRSPGDGPGGTQRWEGQESAQVTGVELAFVQEEELRLHSVRWERDAYFGSADESYVQAEIRGLAEERVLARDTGSGPESVQALVAAETTLLNTEWSRAVERGAARAAREHAARESAGQLPPNPLQGVRDTRRAAFGPGSPTSNGQTNGTGSSTPPAPRRSDVSRNGRRQGHRPGGGRG
ncbi:hypothetical protein [Streptomyces axinellae]|uniref:Uncharacterized protein n=1 Tax=Streptomyces axinellae TaxID=552788 RepID=A0ABN3QCX2_9ACTN